MKAAVTSGIGKAIDSFWSLVQRKKAYFLWPIIALFIIYFLGVSIESIKSLVIISALFFLASVSIIYKRYFRAPPVFELLTFSTVVVTAKYGLVAGMLFGAIVQVVAEVVSGALDAQIVIFVPARVLLAVWTWTAINLFGVTELFKLGIVAIVAYNLMVQPISWFMGDEQLKVKTIYYTVGFSIFNFFIFAILSRPVSFLLGLG